MAIDVLALEVGSTITKANGFARDPGGWFDHVASGFAPTTVAEGDVGVGVDRALDRLRDSSGLDGAAAEVFVNSSAAGGLRMTVHGLARGMTVRAAREAALGAGAIVSLVTAGRLEPTDLDDIRAVRPNIALLAGGVDYGERELVLRNAEALASLGPLAPVVYAGNAVIRRQVEEIFGRAGIELLVADNVFPEVDVLRVEPVRRLVRELFNRHIVHAPGMSRLGDLSTMSILPTPGAVLLGAELFAETIGDCLVVDVGGATTDVHSVTDGSPEWASRCIDPEPRAKRTVEGDLGVFANARNIVEMSGDHAWAGRLDDLRALPTTEPEVALTRWLAGVAAEAAVRRHAGEVSDLYTPTGRMQVVRGKDLTAVDWVVGTGGALTRIPGGEAVLRGICRGPGRYLLPRPEARVLIDREYRFSALGTLAQAYPDEVRATFRRWVEDGADVARQLAGRPTT